MSERIVSLLHTYEYYSSVVSFCWLIQEFDILHRLAMRLLVIVHGLILRSSLPLD